MTSGLGMYMGMMTLCQGIFLNPKMSRIFSAKGDMG
jgi:hypothetical protein